MPMLSAFIFSWETIIVILCLLFLAGGLVRITMRRQTEILKEYLQPDKLRVEQLILRSDKSPPNPAENESPQDAQRDSQNSPDIS